MTFIWLMLLFKVISVGGVLLIVWWALRQTDEQPAVGNDEDGGSKVRPHSRRHPTRPRPHSPRYPRRGCPDVGAPPSAPPRTRSVIARARKVEH
jgi:hypothetical protein